MKRTLVLTVLCLVFVSVVGVPVDAASAVVCGAALPDQPQDKVFHLTHNLTCAPSFDPAIALGDHVILDLGGHTLAGGGTGDGVDAIGKDHASVQNGTIKNFVTPVFFSGGNADHATRLKLFGGAAEVNVNGTTNALIAHDKMNGVGLTCVEVNGADDTIVQSNKMSCSRNGVKIDNAPTDTLVSRNKITAGTIGINDLSSGLAFTRIEHNTIKGGTTGIDLGANAINTSVTTNKVTGASSDGIHVANGALTTAVGNNTTDGNTHDGIFMQATDGGSAIADNVANDNGGYGVEATAAIDDGGGDRAKGNGQFLQCIFVVCY